jgi:hypothetical protein
MPICVILAVCDVQAEMWEPEEEGEEEEEEWSSEGGPEEEEDEHLDMEPCQVCKYVCVKGSGATLGCQVVQALLLLPSLHACVRAHGVV